MIDWTDKKCQMLASSTALCAEAQMNIKRGIIIIKERAIFFRHSFAGVNESSDPVCKRTGEGWNSYAR